MGHFGHLHGSAPTRSAPYVGGTGGRKPRLIRGTSLREFTDTAERVAVNYCRAISTHLEYDCGNSKCPILGAFRGLRTMSPIGHGVGPATEKWPINSKLSQNWPSCVVSQTPRPPIRSKIRPNTRLKNPHFTGTGRGIIEPDPLNFPIHPRGRETSHKIVNLEPPSDF